MLSLCRLCGGCMDRAETSIEISKLESKLRLCCDWKLAENEERLPQRACQMCFDELQRSWSFAEKVSATQRMLQKLSSETILSESEPEPMPHKEDITVEMVKDEFSVDPIEFVDFDSGTFDDQHSASDAESLHSDKRKQYIRKKSPKKTKKTIKKTTKKIKLPSNSKRAIEKQVKRNSIDGSCVNERTITQDKSIKKTAANVGTELDAFVAALPDEDRLSDGSISPNGVIKIEKSFPNVKTMTWDLCQYKCNECTRMFNGPKNYFTHIRSIHWAETHLMDFFCTYCDSKYKREFNLHRHMAEHFPHLKYSCFFCTSYYWDEDELIKHRNLHRDVEYKCEQCDKVNWNRDSLYVHVGRVHHNRKYSDPDATYICDLCHKVCATKTSIKNHLLQHTQQFDYVCDQCGWRFRTKGNLKNHLLTTHGDLRPFTCNQCDKRFKTKAQMEKHAKAHDGFKPFECAECNKRFRNQSNLNVHMRSHNNITPYACKYCDKRFSYTGSLRTHERIHTREKPYACKNCEYKSTNWPNLNKHSLQVHSIDLRIRKTLKTNGADDSVKGSN